MLKLNLFPRESGKDAVLGPPKHPLALLPSGSFGGPRTTSFPHALEKWVWPKVGQTGRLTDKPLTCAVVLVINAVSTPITTPMRNPPKDTVKKETTPSEISTVDISKPMCCISANTFIML